MMAKQMKTRPHRGQHVVDGRLARVDSLAGRIERTRRFVGQEYVDRRERLAREHFFLHEVTTLVVAALPQLDRRRRKRRPSSLRCRKRSRRGVIPARRERSAERSDPPWTDLVEAAVA